jgi:hypothetical protein
MHASLSDWVEGSYSGMLDGSSPGWVHGSRTTVISHAVKQWDGESLKDFQDLGSEEIFPTFWRQTASFRVTVLLIGTARQLTCQI